MVTEEVPRIRSYKFGEIEIDGRRYEKDVIIFPDHVMPNWWRENGHSLGIGDLNQVIQAQPNVLIIGTGANGRMNVPLNTSRKLEEMGIKTRAMPTGEACKEFNRIEKDSNVVAALHLTC